MPTTLNDIIDLTIQPEMDTAKVSAYGFKQAPCLPEEVTVNRATEYMVRYDGRNRRVYNWEQSGRDGRMYIKADGMKLFVTDEVETMLTYGNPSYDRMTPVAGTVVPV
jgi:hypothetical protein